MEQIDAARRLDRDGQHEAAMQLYVCGLEQLVTRADDPAVDAVIEQHTARLEELVSAHAQPTKVLPTIAPLRPGQRVLYESVTSGRWIEAKVVRVHSDGTVSLDVRARADRARIRPIGDAAGGAGAGALPAAIDAASRKYYEMHKLEHTDALGDGFYDGGRGRPLRPLAQLLATPVDEKREVIVADKSTDPALARYVERVTTSIAPLADREAQVLALSLLVSSLMGGHRGEAIEAECQEEMKHLKQQLQSNVVPLGLIKLGCCRHRAVLFKYLADVIGLPTRLVRGAWTDCQIETARERPNGIKTETRELGYSGHAWNVVYIESPPMDTGAGGASGHWRVVDTMLEPGTALLPSNASAVHYTRRIGAASIARRCLPGAASADRIYGGAGCSSLDEAPVPKQPLRPSVVKAEAAEEAEAPSPGALGFESEVAFDFPRVQLGRGSFGTVYKARWRGLAVAVKEISLSSDSSDVQADGSQTATLATALQEVNAMAHLPRHDNITGYFGSYLGASTSPSSGGVSGNAVLLHLVLEYCGGGTLYDALHGHGPPLTSLHRSRIAKGVAAGLAAIHERRPAILHQDLSTNNILLSAADGEPKLADFGLARLRARTTSFHTQHLRGTPHYMSPEVWQGSHITEKVDVYALAMVLYETWTREVPWSTCRVPDIGGLVTRGERPATIGRLPPSYGVLVNKCWAQMPADRPTARQIATDLNQRHDALRELASYGESAFSDVSTTTLCALLKTLGHTADSARPSQLQAAASSAMRLEGLTKYE